MKAPEPPNFRDAADGSDERCGTCEMHDPDTGVCWGFGNKAVAVLKVCDDWEQDPASESDLALGGQLMSTHEQPEGNEETRTPDKTPRRGGKGSSAETRALREEMRGVREQRRVSIGQFEIREVPNGAGGTNLKFEGYASVTCSSMDDHAHTYEMEDWLGPYEEGVVRGAFTKTLGENADVAFLVNHGMGGGVTMARTKPGTLRLHEDLVGLNVDATLNPARSDVQILKAAVADGAIDEMSFAFRVVRQSWSWLEDNGEVDRRWLQEVNLDKGDVSPVNYGANPHTGGLVSMRSAMGALLSGRGLDYRVFADALIELRAGATLSQATRDVLQPILDHLASIDDMVDTDQADLATLLGVTNPDEDDEQESVSAPEQKSAPVIFVPDYTTRARLELEGMRR